MKGKNIKNYFNFDIDHEKSGAMLSENALWLLEQRYFVQRFDAEINAVRKEQNFSEFVRRVARTVASAEVNYSDDIEWIKTLEKNGYAMVMGFPNFMANRIFNSRLGWKTVLEIPTLKLSLNDIDPPGGEELKEGFFEGMTFSGDADLCNVEMSPEYINWRFKNNREKNYKVLSIDSSNWIIYQPYNNEINLTKLSATDISNAKRLIEAVASAGKACGYESLTAWSRINSGVHDLMEKTGFRVASPIRTFGIRCFDASVFETVSDPRKWSLQMGDCNIY